MALIALNGYAGSGKDLVGQMIQYLTSECSKPKMSNHRYRTFDEFVKAGGGSDLRDFNHHYYTDWEIKKFAGKLKEIASMLTGISKHKFEDQEFKKTYLGHEWDTYSIIREDGTRKVATQATPHRPDSVWLKDGINVQVQNRMTVREFLQRLGTDGLRDGLHTNVWVNALFADYEYTHTDHAPNGLDCSNWIITDCRFPNEADAVKDHGGIIIRINRPGITAVNTHPSETALDDYPFDAVITNEGSKEKLLDQVKYHLDKYHLAIHKGE